MWLALFRSCVQAIRTCNGSYDHCPDFLRPAVVALTDSHGPQVGNAGMHGFTAIFGLFIVPQRGPRTAELAFVDAYRRTGPTLSLRCVCGIWQSVMMLLFDARCQSEAVNEVFADLRKHAELVPIPPSQAELYGLPTRLSEVFTAGLVKCLWVAASAMPLAVAPTQGEADLLCRL